MIENKQQPCNQNLIQEYVDHQLSAETESELEVHLARCTKCQMQHDQLMSSSRWWSELRSHLKDEASDYYRLNDVESASDPEQETRAAGHGKKGGNNSESARIDAMRIKSWLGPTDDPAMMGRLAAYEIAGVVGTGGFGIVLKGLDRALNRYVAIKLLAPHLASSATARRRFEREARAAAAVVHDNVIAIHGVAEFNGLPYLVMPFVSGSGLQQRIEKSGPMSLSEILRIAMQTANGLSAAHAQGLVHRDIKPANILMDGTTERVLITDFGLARTADDATMTRSGMIAGTPNYMSPEQWKGEHIDRRSDLFSLGSLIYTMATGRPPFRAETTYGVLRKVAEAESDPIQEINEDLPVWLNEIVRKLHEKNPADRFESASQVSDLLKQCLAHTQRPSGNPLPKLLIKPMLLMKPAQRNHATSSRWRPDWPGYVVAVVLIAGFAIWGSGWLNPERNSKPETTSDKQAAGSQSDVTGLNELSEFIESEMIIGDSLWEIENRISQLESEVDRTAEPNLPDDAR